MSILGGEQADFRINHEAETFDTQDQTTQEDGSKMLKLDDSRWNGLEGGMRIPYDPRPALARLESGSDPKPVWEELWANLQHRGDVGQASYATVPHLVRIVAAREFEDWNLFALASTIELERLSLGNPSLPDWLAGSYERAWEQLFEMARNALSGADDSVTFRCLLATIAIAKGDHRRGRILLDFDDDELDTILGEYQSDDEV